MQVLCKGNFEYRTHEILHVLFRVDVLDRVEVVLVDLVSVFVKNLDLGTYSFLWVPIGR